jgi:hypothetical protein
MLLLHKMHGNKHIRTVGVATTSGRWKIVLVTITSSLTWVTYRPSLKWVMGPFSGTNYEAYLYQ